MLTPMNALSTALLDPANRPQVVDTLVQLAESQVSGMRGISGTMMKTAFAAAKKTSPGSVRQAVDAVLPTTRVPASASEAAPSIAAAQAVATPPPSTPTQHIPSRRHSPSRRLCRPAREQPPSNRCPTPNCSRDSSMSWASPMSPTT